MAFLLYKYVEKSIQKKRASKKQAAGSFEDHLNPPNEFSPAKSDATGSTAETRQGIDNASSEQSEKPKSTETSGEENGKSQTGEPEPGVESPVVERTKEEKKAMRLYRWKLVAGLFLPFSLQALETTVLAGAYPFIASDFSKSSFYFTKWTCAYFLKTSSASSIGSSRRSISAQRHSSHSGHRLPMSMGDTLHFNRL